MSQIISSGTKRIIQPASLSLSAIALFVVFRWTGINFIPDTTVLPSFAEKADTGLSTKNEKLPAKVIALLARLCDVCLLNRVGQ